MGQRETRSGVGRPAELRHAARGLRAHDVLVATKVAASVYEKMKRNRAARGARLAGAAALLLSSSALAQAPEGEPRGAPEPAMHCPPAPDDSLPGPARSEALLQRFRCLFDAGHYQACLPVLDEACKLTDAPRCLYSKAVVHHALYHCELAASYYEAYLARDPYDSVRDEAESALRELRRICGQPAPAPAPPPPIESAIQPLDEQATAAASAPAPAASPLTVAPTPLPVVRERPSAARKVLAFSTLGAGVASGIATAVFASYGRRAESDFEASARRRSEPDGETRALDDNGKRYNTLAWVFLGGSVALLGTSVTLFVLDAKAEESLDISTEGSLSVRYRGHF